VKAELRDVGFARVAPGEFAPEGGDDVVVVFEADEGGLSVLKLLG
jgi:hypothetical protein